MMKVAKKITQWCVLVSTTSLIGCGGSVETKTDPSVFTPETPVSNWEMVWSDDFDEGSINSKKWTHEVNCDGGGNAEKQCYTDSSENSFVQDGKLIIAALPAAEGGELPYTSARINSRYKADFKYGRFEVRAKMPVGQGTWPAIWMLPSDWVYGTWAASGEIDIVEAVNLKSKSDIHGEKNGQPENRTYGTLHYGGTWPNNKHSGQPYSLPNNQNPGDEFYTYSLEWEKDEMRWYVDDVHFATQTSDGWYNIYTKDGEKIIGVDDAPFEQRFHLLLNLAIGGSWAGN